MSDIFSTSEFTKTLYRQGTPLYKGDGNPLSDTSILPIQNIGDGSSGGNTEVVQGNLQSGAFLTGVRGWSIDANGNAEFNNGTFRGTFNIGGTSITINNNEDIQENLDIISTAGGGTLYLQNGTYTLTADILIPSGVTLLGVNRDGVILDCNGTWAVKIVGTNVYSTGTVTINNGDTTVAGSGTTWTSGMIGRFILLDGLWYEITAFTDTTHFTIDEFKGDNLAGSAYVLADTNFSAMMQNLTITGATGSGLVNQYAMETQLNNLVIYDCGTGIEMDYVTYPKLEVTCIENGVNWNANFVEGFFASFNDFSNSTTGDGIIMTNTRNSTFFNSSVVDNVGDGMNLTTCSKIAFISFDISGNGGQGVEFVLGCNDNQFTDGVLDGNASDGIKLTTSSDRNTLVAVSIINNGGYGINIADSTCDNNQIIAPAFSNNTSGNINDSGTNTFVSPQDFTASFVVQDVPFYLGTNDSTTANVWITSDATGTTLFFISLNTAGTVTIYRALKDTTSSNYYITHSTTLACTSAHGIAVVGSVVYVSALISAANALRKYSTTDLSGVTTVTFSGTSRRGDMWSDGTDLYIQNGSTNQFDRFTISGTVATNAGAVTYTSSGAGQGAGAISDGVSVWMGNTVPLTTIRKYAIAGGSATATRAIVTNPAYYPSGSNNISLFLSDSATLGIGFPVNIVSATAILSTALHLQAIAIP